MELVPNDYANNYLIVISVIVYVLRQNCRAAGWRRDSNKNKDWLTYQVNLKYKNETVTKRLILSVIAQLWGPLRLISPIII
jgi:hypothetical protein